MFISIAFRATSIDKTNKTQEKVRGSKFMFKMSTIHANTCIQTTMPLRMTVCMVQRLHIMHLQAVDPLLKDTPGALVHQIAELGGHISGGIKSGVSLHSMVTVSTA